LHHDECGRATIEYMQNAVTFVLSSS